MTGFAPATSGVYENNQPWRKSPVLQNAVTIPQHFRANGYKAIGSGKIYHDAFPDPQSWDEFFPSLDKQKPADPSGMIEAILIAAKLSRRDGAATKS